jgi:succinate dehydrogenase hydrophobic anchor subunit
VAVGAQLVDMNPAPHTDAPGTADADAASAAGSADAAEVAAPVEPGERAEAAAPVAGGPGWSWYLVRVSGLFLAVLLPLHFAVVILRDDVGHTTLGTVTARFADGRWQAIELVTLLLALLHGFLALRRVTLGAVRLSPAARDAVVVALGAAALLLAIAAAWAMLSLS